jgi:hypothetical protein
MKHCGPRASSAVVKPCLCVVAGGPGARIIATLSCDKRTQLLYIPKAFSPQLSGCRLAVIRAAAPHHLQVRPLGADQLVLCINSVFVYLSYLSVYFIY